MKPPERLLDDASIEPELREALRSESLKTVPFDVGAGLARLRDAIDAPPPPVTETGAASALKLKLLIGGGATIAVAALVGLGVSRSDPPPAPSVAPIAAPSITPVVKPPPPAPTPEPPPEVSSKPAPVPSAKAAPVDKQARIAEEIRHLGEVRQLAASNPGAAARKADEGHARFKGGMLYQEREAVAITALARAGRGAEARSRGQRFLQVFPKSPFADQIRSATGL